MCLTYKAANLVSLNLKTRHWSSLQTALLFFISKRIEIIDFFHVIPVIRQSDRDFFFRDIKFTKDSVKKMPESFDSGIHQELNMLF